ncbi:MAG: hypothetical protein IKG87_00725 [Clostridia bacterium]|nr:hypothetical protein [Clostridia bacterium]
MFLRKLTVIMVPLCMLVLLCLLMPMLFSLDWFFGGLLIGLLLGAFLSLLLPLAGATRMREPFAWLLWVPAAVILLVLLYQFLASADVGRSIPVLRLLAVPSGSSGSWIIALESAFAAYLFAFSIRTGRGI